MKTLGRLTHGAPTTLFAGALIIFVTPLRAHEVVRGMHPCAMLECAASAPKTYSFEQPIEDQQPSTQTEKPPKPATTSDHVREGVWRKLPGNFVHDQKDMWVTYPRKLVTGHYLLPTALVVGGTAALIASDHQTAPYFRQTDFFQDSDHALGSKVSGGVLAAFRLHFMWLTCYGTIRMGKEPVCWRARP